VTPERTGWFATPAGKPPADTSYRRNQLPAGVTMVQVQGRYAALRIRSDVTLRTAPDGAWDPLPVRRANGARRPWVVRLELVDGRVLSVRPFQPGEAGLRDCGYRVGGLGQSAPLNNDPVSAVIAVASIALAVLAAPLFVVAYVRRSRIAGRLLPALQNGDSPTSG
jgi:hypothetical protein